MSKLTLISLAQSEAHGILHTENTLDLLPGGFLDDVETILYNEEETSTIENMTDLVFMGEHGEDARYQIFVETKDLPVQLTEFPLTFEDFETLKNSTEGKMFILEINSGIMKNAFFLVA